jgi:hypothetical protein
MATARDNFLIFVGGCLDAAHVCLTMFPFGLPEASRRISNIGKLFSRMATARQMFGNSLQGGNRQTDIRKLSRRMATATDNFLISVGGCLDAAHVLLRVFPFGLPETSRRD